MFNIYLSLVSALIIQLILIDSIFGNVAFKRDANFEMNNLIVNILELVLMIIVASVTMVYFLKNIYDNLTLTFFILLINGLIFLSTTLDI